MSKKYVVEVPPRNPFSHPWWDDVETFDTREEALAYVQKNFGADERGWVPLVKETGSDENE